jgi:hypothetical protein
MLKKKFVESSMTEEQVFNRLEEIPLMNDKIDVIINILQGNGTIENKGVVNIVKATNGKVKWHTKLIFACFGFSMAILGFLVMHIIQK